MGNKKILSISLIITMTISTAVSASPVSINAAQNEFLQPIESIYRMNVDSELSENGHIRVTPNATVTMPISDTEKMLQRSEVLPSAYMNTEAQISAKFPSTRSQGAYGTCWAFSSAAMAEMNLIMKGKATRTVDYSELQLAYFTYHSVADPLGGTAGDRNWNSTNQGYLISGGNRYFSSRILGLWQGFVDEAEVPYTWAAKYANGGLNSKYAYSNIKAKLKNAYRMDLSASNTYDAKKAIMKYGSVGIDYAATYNEFTRSIVYEGESVTAYYCPVEMASNHEVTIVGWDDNFPSSAFNVSYRGASFTPEGNGAWLVRNSWTTNSKSADGDAYFWLSYYDKSLVQECWAFDMVSASEYSANYQYDGGMLVTVLNTLSYNDGTKVPVQRIGNVYTADKDDTIVSVMISDMYAANDTYTIKVYTDLKNENNPTSGTLASTQIGRSTYRGLFTVDLAKPVPITKGSKFAVVVELASGLYNIEYDYNADGKENTYVAIDVSPSGRSFLMYSNTWMTSRFSDYGDFCIKALTNGKSNHTHSYGTPAFSWAKDYKSCTATAKCKCGDSKKSVCTIKQELTKASTFFEQGLNTYTATAVIAGKTYIDKRTEAVPVKVLGKVTLSTAKSSKAKQLTIKWKKNAYATGYELQYATKSSFKNAKTVKIKNARTVSTTIKKLKSKTKYYVRIRAYKTGKVSGKSLTVYSGWSASKNAKVK